MLKDPRIAAAAGIASLALAIVALLALAPWSSGDSSAQVLHQGDANCDQLIDARDALAVLHVAANAPPFAPCAAESGDVNCDGAVNASDAIDIMMYTVGLPTRTAAATTVAGETCPPIGASLNTTTPTASSPPTTPTHSATPTPTPTPTPGPSPDAYGATEVLSASYLGPTANSAIEFALIPGRPNEAVIADQNGYIYHVTLDRSGAPTLWGDVSSLVTPGGEQGLLSLAFSPNYQQDSRVYLYYTEGSPNPSDLVRFTATPEGGLNFVSKEVLLQVEQPYANHDGGHIVFGNDGDLYIGFGDGGSENDPNDKGQDMTTDLSKIIRIDVSGQTGYTVPADNPFVGQSGVRPEIYALGFRNPFRISIDPVTGDLWAGDVGQDKWEEVDRVVKGANYGWSCYEGLEQFLNYGDPANACSSKTFQPPRAVYPHNDSPQNQAVTGGVIYRGAAMPELYGYYVYADFYSGNVWAVNTNDSSPAVQLISHLSHSISDFVLAANGEVYLMTYGDGLYQLSR